MPPPTHCGSRIDPCRARPVPFWRQGLRPPPRTSARVLVEWVPARMAARCARTAACITGTFGSTPKISSGSSTCPALAPSASTYAAVLIRSASDLRRSPRGLAGESSSGLLRLDRRADEHEPSVGSRHGAADQQDVADGVGLDHLEIERGHPSGAELAGHAYALEDA